MLLRADTLSRVYSGSLPSSDAVVEETFSLAAASNLLVTTTSYGGGTNLDGSVASPGGFQPSVTLYTAAGVFVASQAAGSPVATTDPTTGLFLDAYLSRSNVAAGDYILTLTDWETYQPDTATNLSDGFIRTAGATLNDEGSNIRNANYALDISLTPPASAVPEPSTAGVVLLTFSGAVFVARKSTRRVLPLRSISNDCCK